MSKPEYKFTYNPVQFTPEFLEWWGKRQAELIMEIQKLDDDMEIRSIEQDWSPVSLLLPLLISMCIGSVVGAVIGLLIASML